MHQHKKCYCARPWCLLPQQPSGNNQYMHICNHQNGPEKCHALSKIAPKCCDVRNVQFNNLANEQSPVFIHIGSTLVGAACASSRWIESSSMQVRVPRMHCRAPVWYTVVYIFTKDDIKTTQARAATPRSASRRDTSTRSSSPSNQGEKRGLLFTRL